MAKNIFTTLNKTENDGFVQLVPPTFGATGLHYNGLQASNLQPTDDEVYEGPTADELRAEAEQIIQKATEEAKLIIAEAEQKATALAADAEEARQTVVKQVEDKAVSDREACRAECDKLVQQAEEKATKIRADAEAERDSLREASKKEGQDQGREAGYAEGYAEIERLIERLHTIINRTVEKRNNIIDEVETQVVELALLMVRKVVKVIAENQKSVVINNIIQALNKLKGRSDITIRVNMDDIEMVSSHRDQFVKSIEGNGELNFIEDSSIEKGGCIIETDFGEVDARISSQLSEIENRIRDLMPINIRPKINEDNGLYTE